MQNEKLYSLELLRFIAACCIFFGHYVHFYDYFQISSTSGIFYKINPSHWGGLAVPLFFMMSGAIFTRNYEVLIREKEISLKEFFLKRFARLYPLHLITLIIVAILQFWLLRENGKYFIYQINDLKHFMLHLFFASHWGFEAGNSFNSPVWSVSHEIVLYFFFFITCILSRRINYFFLNIGMVAILVPILSQFLSTTLLKSLFAFFVGGLIFGLMKYIFQFSNNSYSRFAFLSILGILTCALNRFFERHGLPFGSVGPMILALALFLDFIVSANLRNSFFSKLEVLGGLSYSSYLLHFPLQILLVFVSIYIIDINFSSTYILLMYVSVVLLASIVSYKYIEKPLQQIIIHKFWIPFEKN